MRVPSGKQTRIDSSVALASSGEQSTARCATSPLASFALAAQTPGSASRGDFAGYSAKKTELLSDVKRGGDRNEELEYSPLVNDHDYESGSLETKVRSGLRPSLHGLVGTLLIGGFIAISALRSWNVSFLYLVAAIVPYAAIFAYVASSSRGQMDSSRFHTIELSAHFSLLLLLGGFYLGFPGFWRNVAVFLIATAAGMALSLQYLRR